MPLSAKAVAALTRLGVKSEGSVFTYSSHGIKSTWRFMLQRLGIKDLHFHDMRHEAISRLFELGTLDMMEIAAITGHKSLSMLKRYTHLRASKLVHKLEGNRNKARLAVMRDLVPYPGVITESAERRFEIHFPDFEHVKVAALGATLNDAIAAARDILLRTILGTIREGKSLPAPDQYTPSKMQCRVLMIDPMAMA